MLIIHAPNVHQGGGRTLLLALLEALRRRNDCTAILDTRLCQTSAVSENLVKLRVSPSIPARLGAEWQLRALARDNDTVLCFGNLPPLFRVKGKVVLFIQNRYLTGNPSLSGFSLLKKLQIRMERLWLSWQVKHVSEIIVQTPSMKCEVLQKTGVSATVLPFFEKPSDTGTNPQNPPESKTLYDFVYVASGEPHKNHRNLIEAWKLLSAEDIRPSLRLTVSEKTYPSLCVWIEAQRKKHELQIENTAVDSQQGVEKLYEQATALIYPSLMESLGLPLVEAAHAGLPILAVERDYVRDVVEPQQTFDPDSPVSIARAVKRFLGKQEKLVGIVGTETFIQHLLAGPR